MKKLSVCFLGIMMGVSGALAAPSPDDLKKIEEQLRREEETQKQSREKASELSYEIRELQQKMIRSAKSIQEKEGQLLKLEKNMQALKDRQRDLEDKLSLTDAQMTEVVTGLQTLALHPKEILFLKPLAPVDTLRSQLLMRYSIPVIGSVNQTLQNDLADLTKTRADIQQKIIQAKTLTSQLAERNNYMEALLKQKSVLQAQYDASHVQAKKRAESLAGQAKDLKDLLTKLEMEQKRKEEAKRLEAAKNASTPVKVPPPPGGKSAFEKSYGALLYPAKGYIIQTFGEVTASSAHVKGMTISTRPQAQVITPFDGTVLFSGPFKTYGQMLIVDNGGGYMTLLAGLGAINAAVGQELLAGEPIGIMDISSPRLYIEIRKDGQAIDPGPWFVPQN
ncbi:MAG: peptidoglycan DD-metalloendopeptidase family protein [Lactobacillales bacterium]|jgi:septal ring factor EnvC (AmiA/AmiB activator)|nr:peptidoglycan DD-metalloendopeptidase family protein [Lactobacillales bacterium]